jgi:hypothetical protein
LIKISQQIKQGAHQATGICHLAQNPIGLLSQVGMKYIQFMARTNDKKNKIWQESNPTSMVIYQSKILIHTTQKLIGE